MHRFTPSPGDVRGDGESCARPHARLRSRRRRRRPLHGQPEHDRPGQTAGHLHTGRQPRNAPPLVISTQDQHAIASGLLYWPPCRVVTDEDPMPEVDTDGYAEMTVPVEERLVYQGEVFVNFQTSRQWVSAKLFVPPPDIDDFTVLQLLFRHVRYRDSYGGTGDKDMENIHGPYWLYVITPEIFTPASAVDAEALIRTWAEYDVSLTDDDRAAMESEIYPR